MRNARRHQLADANTPGTVDFALNGLNATNEKCPVQGRDTQQIINALPVCIAKQERAGVMVLHVIYRQKNKTACAGTQTADKFCEQTKLTLPHYNT